MTTKIGRDDMKIEKINENQIRCTLTKQDLENHQVRLSELAYGTDKAKRLFRDMMQQAQLQFGFEADNIPLMIEAIPVSTDSIILIITKVEDPEELDTRFSKFAPLKKSEQTAPLELDGADSIIDMFHKIMESGAKRPKKAEDSPIPSSPEEKEIPVSEEPVPINIMRLYTFRTLDYVIDAAHGLKGFFNGENTLYKDPVTGDYQLVLHQTSCPPEDFNKVCNILSEYGKGKTFTPAEEAHFREHGELISKNALQQLMQI